MIHFFESSRSLSCHTPGNCAQARTKRLSVAAITIVEVCVHFIAHHLQIANLLIEVADAGFIAATHLSSSQRTSRQQTEQMFNLPECKSLFLCPFDEPDHFDRLCRIIAIARGQTMRLPEQTSAFIEPYGLNIDSGLRSNFTDAHLNVLRQWKKYAPCTKV